MPQIPPLNTNFVPDAAGAQQNALRTQGMGMQNQLAAEQVRGIPQQREMGMMELQLKRTALEIQKKALETEDTGEPISIDYPEFSVKGPKSAIMEVADAVAKFPDKVKDPNFAPWVASKGVSYTINKPSAEGGLSDIGKLIKEMDNYPAGHPARKFYESKLNKLTSGTEGGQSELGKLIAERDSLPVGDPAIKFYNDKIKKITSLDEGKTNSDLSYKDVVDLQAKFQAVPEVKEFVTISTQVKRAEEAILEARTGKGSMNAVDQSLITLMNKILDPTSVVRESEYARTPEGMSALERMKGWAGKISAGGAGLSSQERESLYTMINKFYSVSEKMYNDQVNYYTDLAKRKGVDPADVVRLGAKKAKIPTAKTAAEMTDEELKKALGLTNAK